jgi:hypothetical protein
LRLGPGGPELDGGGRAICAPDARLPNSSRIVVAPSELSNMRLLSILSRALPALPLLVASAERLWRPSPPCTGSDSRPTAELPAGPPPVRDRVGDPLGRGRAAARDIAQSSPQLGGLTSTKALLTAPIDGETGEAFLPCCGQPTRSVRRSASTSVPKLAILTISA